MKLHVLPILFLTAIVTVAAAPSRLVPAVEKVAASLPAGGFVVAQVDGEQATYTAVGPVSPHAGIRPENIEFEIGSITKLFTGLLLAQATVEGKASPDDPIAKWLPADLKLDPKVAAITLAQLSTHTSGLPSLPTNFTPANQSDPYADYDVARLYAFLQSYHPAVAAPQPADYSNVGVGLLGHLLTRIYGESYGDLVRAKITGPLGMHDTVIELSPDQQARFAVPHSGGEVVLPWRLDALAGAGALRSTAADLAKFVQALMQPDSPLARAWAVARQPRARYGRSGHIGLGFMMVSRDGHDVYNHSGGTGGFRTYLEFTPDTGQATILLLNNDTIEPATIVMALHRKPEKPLAATAEAISADELPAYAGVYAIDARARFTALVHQGQLLIRLTGQSFLPVAYGGHDRFFAKAVGAEFQFERNPAGQVTGVTLQQHGQTIPAQRENDAQHLLFPDAKTLEAYAGTYRLTPQVVFEMHVRHDQLFVKLTGQPDLPVFCTSPDNFVYDVVEATLTFTRNAGGNVNAVILHQNGMDQRALRE